MMTQQCNKCSVQLTQTADPEAGSAGPGLGAAPVVALGVCVADARVPGGGGRRALRVGELHDVEQN